MMICENAAVQLPSSLLVSEKVYPDFSFWHKKISKHCLPRDQELMKLNKRIIVNMFSA